MMYMYVELNDVGPVDTWKLVVEYVPTYAQLLQNKASDTWTNTFLISGII